MGIKFKMTIKNESLYKIHGAVLLFGLAGVFGKLISLSPIAIVFGRTFFAAIFLFFLLLYLKEKIFLNNKRDYFSFIILGIVLAIHWTTFFKAIQLSTVAIGLITFSTFPIFVTFIEPIVFHERIEFSGILIAVITLVGVLFVVPDFRFESRMTTGALWGILSGFTFALLSVLNKKYVSKYSSLVIAFYQNSIAAIVLFPFVLFIRPSLNARNILLVVLLGIVFTGVSHSLFIASMKNIKAQTASIIACLEPVYGIIASMFLIGEMPGIKVIIGGIIILGAAFYSTIMSNKILNNP